MPQPASRISQLFTQITSYVRINPKGQAQSPNQPNTRNDGSHTMLSAVRDPYRMCAGEVGTASSPNPRSQTNQPLPDIQQKVDRRISNKNRHIQYLRGRTIVFDFNKSLQEIDEDHSYEISYFTNQANFAKRTKEVINHTSHLINSYPPNFQKLIQHLGGIRQSLASDKDPHKAKFGMMRTTTLRTGLIDETYYKLGKKMIVNMISHSSSSDSTIIREDHGRNLASELPGCGSYTYELFTNNYPDDSQGFIPTTKVAIASSDAFIPHKNGLALLDYKADTTHIIRYMMSVYHELIARSGKSIANDLYHEQIHSMIGGKYDLKVIPNEFSPAKYETWEIIHTEPEHISCLLRHANKAYDRFCDLKKKQ